MSRTRVLLLATALLVPSVGAALVAAPADAADPLTVHVVAPAAVAAPVSSLRFSWTVTGASGSVAYQLREGAGPRGGIDWGDPQPSEDNVWDALPVAAGNERCVEVSATDDTGTASAVSCTYLDDTAPWIGWSGVWSPVRPQLARTPVAVRYAGGDDDRVSSYDLLARVAPAGRAWGPWARIAGPTASTTIARTWPAGANVCFLARVRDRVGHLTRTSAAYDPRCTTVPYDDRGLTRSTTAIRARASWALGGTVTVLTGKAALTGPRTPVRTVWISMRGRGGYCPRLWVGGRRIAQWRCHWSPIGARPGYQFTLPRTLTGRAVIRAGQYDSVRVDAVAFAR